MVGGGSTGTVRNYSAVREKVSVSKCVDIVCGYEGRGPGPVGRSIFQRADSWYEGDKGRRNKLYAIRSSEFRVQRRLMGSELIASSRRSEIQAAAPGEADCTGCESRRILLILTVSPGNRDRLRTAIFNRREIDYV